MSTTVITIKLTPTEVLGIETVMEKGHYDSRSSLIRAGLGAIFDRHKLDRSFDKAIEAERAIHSPRVSRVKRKMNLDSPVIQDDCDADLFGDAEPATAKKKRKETKKRKVKV